MKTISKEELERRRQIELLESKNYKLEADMAYIAMMADVVIPEGEENEESHIGTN